MDFLYTFGFDLASMHVHPMSNDGQQDYYTVTGIAPEFSFPTQIAVIHNSILIMTLIAQTVFNYSSFRWRSILWDFLDHIRSAIDTGSKEYMTTSLKIIEFRQNKQGLSEKS